MVVVSKEKAPVSSLLALVFIRSENPPIIFGPNITGFAGGWLEFNNQIQSGALARINIQSAGAYQSVATNFQSSSVNINAHTSNSYYGASDKPQVDSNQALMIIKA